MCIRDRSKSSSSSSSSSSSAKSKPAAAPASAFYEELFHKYKDEADSIIGPEGIERLCADIELEPTDVLVLVLAWSLGASQMGYFTHEEWKSAAPRFCSVTSTAELRERLAVLFDHAQGSLERFRDLHQFAHKFCREERKKTIDAVSYTHLTLPTILLV